MKVTSSEEIENAFRAITSQERDYVTQEELYSNLSKEMADYCIARMKPYVDPKSGQSITGEIFLGVFCRNVDTLLLFQVLWTTWNSPQDYSPKHLLL